MFSICARKKFMLELLHSRGWRYFPLLWTIVKNIELLSQFRQLKVKARPVAWTEQNHLKFYGDIHSFFFFFYNWGSHHYAQYCGVWQIIKPSSSNSFDWFQRVCWTGGLVVQWMNVFSLFFPLQCGYPYPFLTFGQMRWVSLIFNPLKQVCCPN